MQADIYVLRGDGERRWWLRMPRIMGVGAGASLVDPDEWWRIAAC